MAKGSYAGMLAAGEEVMNYTSSVSIWKQIRRLQDSNVKRSVQQQRHWGRGAKGAVGRGPRHSLG